jgi:hypothetical protein
MRVSAPGGRRFRAGDRVVLRIPRAVCVPLADDARDLARAMPPA